MEAEQLTASPFEFLEPHVVVTQQSDAAHTVVAQLTADKSFFNDWPVGHDEEGKGVLSPSVLAHVGVVQHSFPLFAQKVQVVVSSVPVLKKQYKTKC